MNTDAAGPDDDPEALEQAVQAAVQAARQETALEENAGHSPAGRAKPAKRDRVVLAKRRSSRRVVRTLAELEDQTSVGKALVRQLMWLQLMLSIRLMLLTMVVLVSIPLAFLLAPSLGTTTILGLRLPWLLLGFAVYPFFVAVAWSYNRSADRTEQAFAEWVEN
ncbi:MAG TPA: hypothetical protein VN327_07735 [Pseudonocardiaceae bacterium]|jgi:uncharacterized membrane protein|nr:hypothetical protein [Pseudonocardiaceae bacterium]